MIRRCRRCKGNKIIVVIRERGALRYPDLMEPGERVIRCPDCKGAGKMDQAGHPIYERTDLGRRLPHELPAYVEDARNGGAKSPG